MQNKKHIIALFYLVLMLLFKVAGLHALSHDADDGDIQQCEVCHITAAASVIPLLEIETVVLPKPHYFVVQKVNTTTLVAFNSQHLSSFLFTRPPPQVS